MNKFKNNVKSARVCKILSVLVSVASNVQSSLPGDFTLNGEIGENDAKWQKAIGENDSFFKRS